MWKISHQSNKASSSAVENAQNALLSLTRRSDIGFFDLQLLQYHTSAAQELAASLRGSFDQVCVLGIGGSSLGAMALAEALAPSSLEQHKILFFDNVDAKSFYRKLALVKNPSRALWLLVSKSGTTIETLSQADYIDQYLRKNFKVKLADKAVAITEKRASPLYDWATAKKVPCLEVPVNVGGRYSVLTAVGLFPAALLGVDVQGLLNGAEAALKNKAQHVDLTAQLIASHERGETTIYFFPYCDDMRYWGQWIQQLWAESLGKKTNSKGAAAPAMSVPYSCRGSTDQHSVLQQIAEGTQKKFVCFLRVSESEKFGEALATFQFNASALMLGKGLGELLGAEAEATQQALNEAQVHSITLETAALSPESLGYLMMTWQLVVAAVAAAMDINAFDQPGVERGKVLTRSILSR